MPFGSMRSRGARRIGLYKVVRHIRKFNQESEIFIPLVSVRARLSLDMSRIKSDMLIFDECYTKRSDADACERAVELYRGTLFGMEPYEWAYEAEAYYDIRHLEMLEILEKHYEAKGNSAKARYFASLAGAE